MLFLTSSSFKALGEAYSEEMGLLKQLFENRRMIVTITADHIKIEPEK
jgi:hypothetical protein